MSEQENVCASCGRVLTDYDAVCVFCENELASYQPVLEIPSPSDVAARDFEVSAYFGTGHATIYDRRIRQRCPSYDALHAILPHFLTGLSGTARILSAGAGTGAEILSLGRHFPACRFVAADISADMLEVCRERMTAAGLAQRVDFHHGPVQDLAADATFDAATSVLVSHFILDRSERLAYYRAIADRLKPGGAFILVDLFGDMQTPAFSRLFETWLASFAEHAGDASNHELDRVHILRDIAFLPEAELVAMLEEAGFDAPTRFYQTWLFGGWAMSKGTPS